MDKWQTKIIGQLERLNSHLRFDRTDSGITITHSKYGFVSELTPDDDEPIQIVREVLFELSEQYITENT